MKLWRCWALTVLLLVVGGAMPTLRAEAQTTSTPPATPSATQPATSPATYSASPDTPEPIPTFDSPHATVQTFLTQMQRIDEGRGDVERAWLIVQTTLDTSQVESTEVRPAAHALYEAIHKVGLPGEGLPGKDVLDGRTRYVLFPRAGVHNWVWDKLEQRNSNDWTRGQIVLEAHDGQWRFTAATVAQAENLARTLAPSRRSRCKGSSPPRPWTPRARCSS